MVVSDIGEGGEVLGVVIYEFGEGSFVLEMKVVDWKGDGMENLIV